MSISRRPTGRGIGWTRKLSLESLEQRTLLSVDPLLATLASAGRAEAAAALVAPAALSDLGQVNGNGANSAKATGSDDYGDTFSTAYLLTLDPFSGNASVSGIIGTSRDVDMFKLMPVTSGKLMVNMNKSAGALDPYLTLYDGAQNKVAENNDTPGSQNASVTIDVMKGANYYIKATGFNRTTGSYSIQISNWSPPPPTLPGPGDYSAQNSITWTTYGASGSVLVVLGTSGNDLITLSQTGNNLTVNGTDSGFSTTSIAGIAIYGFDGNDTLRETYSISSSLISVMYAGVGNDTIYENGQDAASLYGQDGDDLLVSVGGGADVLYGGAGNDSFWFDSTDTLSDAEEPEITGKAIHQITSFSSPGATLDIAGQDMSDPKATGGYRYTNNFVNQPLWVDGPQYNDIRQGALGDCYFLAGLSALAQTDPNLVQQSITALGDGTYAVRFYRSLGVEYKEPYDELYYRIDAQLPTSGSEPAYAKLTGNNADQTKELWVPLLEKAFAQFRSPGQNSYKSIEGGWVIEAYAAVTGTSPTYYYTSTLEADALASKMAADLAAGHAVGAGSSGSIDPIVGGHAYEIHSVEQVGSTWYVTVYNPWGRDGRPGPWDSDIDPNDGLLTLTALEFQARFSTIDVSLA